MSKYLSVPHPSNLPKLSNLRTLLTLSLIAGVACFFLSTASSSAATIDVAAGTDAINDNGTCQLSEAIENINDATQTHDDCIETGAYGTNDTINLPSGTILLSGNLHGLTQPVTIIGQGMGQTIIDGDGQWSTFATNTDFTARGMTITAFLGFGVRAIGNGAVSHDQIEIDGTGAAPDGSLGGYLLVAPQVSVTNSYIHNLAADGQPSVFGISIQAAQGGSVSAIIENVTIENISSADSQVNGISFATGVFDGSLTPGTITAVVANSTIAGIVSDTNSVSGIGAIAAINSGDTEVNVTVNNNTITNVVGGDGFIGESANIAIGGMALGASDTATITVMGSNNILAGDSAACFMSGDLAPVFGAGTSAGTINTDISSSGGNLSDDNSCTPYFDHASDQNNVAALAASLSPLADNGGFVPTMALMETSPAVDGGVTISGLTTDARGQTRPQGLAYDSGAYESPFARTTPPPPTDDGEGLAESGATIVGIIAIAVLILGIGMLTLRKPKAHKGKK